MIFFEKFALFCCAISVIFTIIHWDIFMLVYLALFIWLIIGILSAIIYVKKKVEKNE